MRRFESITSTIVKGYALAGEPRNGPVHVEVPFDLLRQKGEVAQYGSVTERRHGQAAVTEAVTRFIESSRNPLIYAGKIVARDGAVDELVALAERLEAPVIINAFYPDAFPINHRLFAG